MKYSRNDVGINISIEQVDGFGKNPGLWIGTDFPNQSIKVASFDSEKKAKQFIQWLDCLIGHTDEVKWE